MRLVLHFKRSSSMITPLIVSYRIGVRIHTKMEQIFLLFLGWLLSLAILRCWEGRVVCLLSILVYSFSQSVSLSVQPRAKPGRVTSSQSPPASALTSAEAARPGLASILREEEGGGGRWSWLLCTCRINNQKHGAYFAFRTLLLVSYH